MSMIAHVAYLSGNRLLDAVPLPGRRDVIKHAQVVDFASGQVAQEPESDHDFVDFPIDAVLSVVTTMLDGKTCEVGTISREGVAAADVALGATLLRTIVCQVAGRVARIPRRDFVDAVQRVEHFDRLVTRARQAQQFFVEQQCACNAVHSLHQRCARWFSTIQAGVGRDEFSVTHDFLSVMLGVRRATVTLAAQTLQNTGVISYRRGNVKILDTGKLSAACCECAAVTVNVFDSALTLSEEYLSEWERAR